MYTAVICPTYIVKPGDTLSSIAASNNINPADLATSITACGAIKESLSPGQTICFPGAELPGCPNVRSFLGNDNCKFYISQLGDSIASIAASLNLYQPDMEKANADIQANQLKEGDLLKLLNWDTSKCGILPPTIEQLNSFLNQQQQEQNATPPPPSSPQKFPPPNPPQNNNINSIIKPGTTATTTVNATNCRAYRAVYGDTLFTVAATFDCPAADLLQINPDLADGLPVMEGSVVRLPPYDPGCLQPVLITADTMLSPPMLMPLDDGLMANNDDTIIGSSGSDNKPVGEGEKKGKVVMVPSPKSAAPSDMTSSYDNDSSSSNSSGSSNDDSSSIGIGGMLGGGGGGTVAPKPPLTTNIISDAASGYPSPPQQPAVNVGMLITILFCAFILFAIVGVLGMSCVGNMNSTSKLIDIESQ